MCIVFYVHSKHRNEIFTDIKDLNRNSTIIKIINLNFLHYSIYIIYNFKIKINKLKIGQLKLDIIKHATKTVNKL